MGSNPDPMEAYAEPAMEEEDVAREVDEAPEQDLGEPAYAYEGQAHEELVPVEPARVETARAPMYDEDPSDLVTVNAGVMLSSVLTAFPDGETRADQPLALVPPPMVRPPPVRSEFTSLPTSEPSRVQKPALVQFRGHFDEEETSTGDAAAIEALALEEERLAREAEEAEIAASGLLDDGSMAARRSDVAPRSDIDDEPIDVDDDVEILESDPPDERTAMVDAHELLARAESAAEQSGQHDEDEDVAGTDPPSSSEEARAPIWAAQPPSDDFERAVGRFASSAPRAPAAPLELEDLDDLSSSPPQQSQAAVSSSVLFDVADLGAIERAHEEESDVRHIEPRMEPAPKSSPRPVAYDEEHDPDLAMDSEPPESGEVESQPYPKSVRQISEPAPDDPYASHGLVDDGLSEPPPPTMHTLPGYDDEPTPRPVQVPTTEMRSLGSVDVLDRTRVGHVESVAVFEPRRDPAPTNFGAILDQALSLLKP